jgi:hypothetical protein
MLLLFCKTITLWFPLLDERRHFYNKFLAGNDHVIDIFILQRDFSISSLAKNEDIVT